MNTQPVGIANVLCLDFTNTVNVRPNWTSDALATCSAAWEWAAAAGLGRRRHDTDTDALLLLRDLRERLHRVFFAISQGTRAPAEDLRSLVAAQSERLTAAAWERREDVLVPSWPAARRLSDLAGPISDSALTLLRHGPLSRVGSCPGCGWLFLDVSRNGQRRWCSMATCGSRDKAARYSSRRPRKSGALGRG